MDQSSRNFGDNPVPLPSDDAVVFTPVTVVETSLYAEDLDSMEQFYSRVLNLKVIDREAGRHVFFSVGNSSVLLVFRPETTCQGHHLPVHGATGASHVALGVPADRLSDWKTRLAQHDVEIEREQAWPRGGHSLYFRDPAGNSIELVTPGVWGTPSGW